MTNKRPTNKGPEKSGSVITRRKVRDGVIAGELVSVDLTTGDTPAELAALRELFPSVSEQVQAHASRAQAVIDAQATGPRLNYAKDALRQSNELLFYLDKGDAPGAVQHALWMMLALWRMDVKGVEPEIVTGAKRREGGRRGNATRAATAATNTEELQAKADELWRKNLKLSITAVAKKIAPTRWDSVRKVIKKTGI